MREVVLDTETTGLSPDEGHRIVEVAAVELVDRRPTGRHFHAYLNPGRPMPPEAAAVHGLTDSFLADKPPFSAVADALLAFLEAAPVVAHNAAFDARFLAFELEAAGRPALPPDRFVDTVELARRRFPGAKHSLDALCARFGIDLSVRAQHGALTDARLLAEVYVELTGGRQIRLDLAPGRTAVASGAPARAPRPARLFSPTAEEEAAHDRFIEGIPNALWRTLPGH